MKMSLISYNNYIVYFSSKKEKNYIVYFFTKKKNYIIYFIIKKKKLYHLLLPNVSISFMVLFILFFVCVFFNILVRLDHCTKKMTIYFSCYLPVELFFFFKIKIESVSTELAESVKCLGIVPIMSIWSAYLTNLSL